MDQPVGDGPAEGEHGGCGQAACREGDGGEHGPVAHRHGVPRARSLRPEGVEAGPEARDAEPHQVEDRGRDGADGELGAAQVAQR